jgi:hypothetical protein
MNSNASDQAIDGRRATTRRASERASAAPLCASGDWAFVGPVSCKSD